MALGELAALVGGEVRGDPALLIRGVNGLSEARPGELAFYNNSRYRGALQATAASAVVVNAQSVPLLEGRAGLVAGDPYLAFALISAAFHPRPRFSPGIDPRAGVETGAQVDPSATVMAFAFVSRGARVGPRAVLFPHVFVGEESEIGADALLYPGAVIRERCRLGPECIVHSGVVIGADGFGFAFDASGPRHFKIPQVGTVEIGADVEIGANSAIDRATLGATRVGNGAKIDNLVQVGHNAHVGPLAILCGQVGLAGSSAVGAGAVMGGQSAVTNHVKVGDRARVGGQSGVLMDLEPGGEYMGTPPQRLREHQRSQVALAKLPETNRRMRALEKKVEELEAKLAALLSKKA